jgi:hypothetical protein
MNGISDVKFVLVKNGNNPSFNVAFGRSVVWDSSGQKEDIAVPLVRGIFDVLL